MTRAMVFLRVAWIGALLAAASVAAHEGHDVQEAGSGATVQAPHVFDRLKLLVGEWVAAEAAPSFKQGELISRYALTGGGTALVDTLFPGKPYEMTTVYTRDGADLALTHYCTAGNQPHLRATAPAPNARVLELAFDGGSNLDPSHDSHMHSARLQLVGPDEIVVDWQSWDAGMPNGSPMRLHLLRKK